MPTTTSHPPNKTIADALAELASVRDEARVQMHLLSLEAKQRWNELEAKLEALPSDGAADTALTRLRELTRVARAFVDEHRRPANDSAAAIMTRQVRTCSPDDSLNEAARIMWESDCGAVPVTDAGGKLLGVITDRDVCMAAYTRGQPLWACAVGSVMSAPCYYCAPTDSIERIADTMREHRIRRLPVADSEGRLLGIVAIADLVRSLQSSGGASSRAPWFAATLAEISTPHATHQVSAAQ
jgi:CBS domain-containing protein